MIYKEILTGKENEDSSQRNSKRNKTSQFLFKLRFMTQIGSQTFAVSASCKRTISGKALQ